MKKIILFILAIATGLISFNSCIDLDEQYEENQRKLKEYNDAIYAQFGKDTVLINEYLADSNLVAQKDSSGVYYIIEKAGSELHPNDNSNIEVYYKGSLLDGTVFSKTDSTHSFTGTLNTLISGWRIGVPKIGTGGKIKLILPSYYGYGTIEYGTIPPNSVLIFDIELLSFY